MRDFEKEMIVEEIIKKHCTDRDCDRCGFFNPYDDTDGINFCHARDFAGNVPYSEKWFMRSALLSD